MSKIFLLVKVFLKSSFQFNYNVETKNTSKLQQIAMPIFLIITMLYVIGILGFISKGLIDTLISVNQEAVFLGIFLLLLSAITIIQTIFSGMSIFYLSKDLEYILPLPIKPFQILIAKFLTLIINTYLGVFIMGIAPIMLYGILTGAGALFYIAAFLVILVFPILPAAIVSLLLMIVMSFNKFMKNKDLYQIMIGVLAIGIAVGAQLMIPKLSVTDPEQVLALASKANGLVEIIGKYFITIVPAINAMTSINNANGIISMFELIAITAVGFVAFILIGQKVYFMGLVGNAASGKKHSSTINENKAYRKNSIAKTYILKEFKGLFKNPIYFMQCVLPYFLLPVIMLVSITAGKSSIDMSMFYTLNPNTLMVFMGILLVGQFLNMTNFVSVTAISRDGGNATFVKYIPLSYYTQFMCKIVPGIILGMLPLLFTVVVVKVIFPGIMILPMCIVLIISVLLNILENYLMFIVDLKRPKLEWISEYAVVKQNLNMIFGFIFTIVSMSIFAVIMILCSEMNYYLILSLLTIIVLVILFIVNKYVRKNQVKLFERIQ